MFPHILIYLIYTETKKKLNYISEQQNINIRTCDRQDHEVNITQLYSKFKSNVCCCIDLSPEFLVTTGELINILVHTDVTRYRQIDGSYLNEVARPTYVRIILYVQSVAKYGKSPYIYPLYGLGELPQGFARLSAIYGGTYMLDTPIDEVLYEGEGEEKKFAGVVTKEGTAKAPIVIAGPTYFPNLVEKVGEKVIRAICILDHPVPGVDLDSLQLIIPQNQVGRKHDIYVA
ncbi:Rab GDP-dissociation inhibitor, partial [Spathaspora sp. JA1]